jgi:hypothetical protein
MVLNSTFLRALCSPRRSFWQFVTAVLLVSFQQHASFSILLILGSQTCPSIKLSPARNRVFVLAGSGMSGEGIKTINIFLTSERRTWSSEEEDNFGFDEKVESSPTDLLSSKD